MGGSLAQMGMAKETTFGTPVAVTKFFEFSKESITGSYDRVQADALSASLFDRADRFAVAPKGAAGDVTIEVLSKGFGDWLLFMLGQVETGDAVETVVYTHTATPGNLSGKSFTLQIGRPRSDDTIVPWTYGGGKITKWELSNSVDQTLQMQLSMDFANEANPASPSGAFALQSATQVSGAEVYTWQKGVLNIGGTPVDVTDVSVSCDNGLKVDRYFIRGNTAKKEQIQDSKRKIEASFKCDYDSDTLWRMVSSANAAGAMTTLEATWTGLNVIGTDMYPSITVTVPALRFDEGAPVVDGPSMLDQSFSMTGYDNGTDAPITVAYTSLDATVLGDA